MASQSINFKPTTLIKQLPWRLDRHATVSLLLILATFSMVGWLYLGQASIITSSTMKIDDLQQKVTLLNQQNNEIAVDIARQESIHRIEARAIELGFAPTDPTAIRYLPAPALPIVSTPVAVAVVARSNPVSTSAWQVWLDHTIAWIAGDTAPASTATR